jgi:hypothetical protein
VKRMLLTAALAASLALVGTATEAAAATRLGGVDMQRACDKQYPGFGLQAVVLDQNNAFSWRCAAPWDNTRGIDVNKACAEQYGPGAFAGLDSVRNPYSWFCQR